MAKSEWKRRAGFLGAFLGAAAMLSIYAPGATDTRSLGASPAGRRAPYELVVTLESPDLPRVFEHTIALTRSQYEDVRFSPRKARKKALKKAQKALAKKLGYDEAVFTDSAKLSNARLKDIELVDTRREHHPEGRVSIRRDGAIS